MESTAYDRNESTRRWNRGAVGEMGPDSAREELGRGARTETEKGKTKVRNCGARALEWLKTREGDS